MSTMKDASDTASLEKAEVSHPAAFGAPSNVDAALERRVLRKVDWVILPLMTRESSLPWWSTGGRSLAGAPVEPLPPGPAAGASEWPRVD